MDFFDTLDDTSSYVRNDKPIWQLNVSDPKSEDVVHKWLLTELSYLKNINQDRIREQYRNVALYKGIQYFNQEVRRGTNDRDLDRSKVAPKLVINHIYDYTEQKTARLMRFKPAIAVLPAHDQQKDKVNSKKAKVILDDIQYREQFDSKAQLAVRSSKVLGESYLFTVFNHNKGPLHPDFLAGEKEPMLDESGKPVLDETGNPVYISEDVHIGEVEYFLEHGYNILLQDKRSYDECEYLFRITRRNIYELKAQYPEAAGDIQADRISTFYNTEQYAEENMGQDCYVYEFWHKNTQFMAKGRKIFFTKDVILENKELGYSHGDFPCDRLTDIDVPGELYAKSFYINVKGPAGHLNNITNMIVRNQLLVSHPKWFVPRGAVKLESLNNDISIVQYQGNQPPVLAQANPTPTEMFNFRKDLKEDMNQMSGVYGISRGEPPPGVKAGVAMQFLNEQENERSSSDIAKLNEWYVRIAKKTLSVAADFYDATDKRSIMVQGKNNSWELMDFDPEVLKSDYDIRVQNVSALSESKAQRMQNILDLSERFPDLFTSDQISEMLDFAQSEKFLDEASAAIRAAEYENEKIFDGDQVDEPQDYEMHDAHWKTHMKAMQDPSFKRAPPEIKQAMIDHVMATEMMMFDQAKKNPAYEQVLMSLKQFPSVFTPIPDPAVMPPPPPPLPMDAPSAPVEPVVEAAPPLEEVPQEPLPPMI